MKSDHSEQFSILFNAQQHADVAFRKLNNIFGNFNQQKHRMQNKIVWDLATQNTKNKHLPHYLLDDDREIKSVLDTYEYLFPEVEKYTQLERSSNLMSQINQKFTKPPNEIYRSQRQFSSQLLEQSRRFEEKL